MRHGDKINNLGRTKAHRKALMINLACQLIEYKRINTTLAKAKSLRVFVEPLITKSKTDSTHNRRLVFDKLQDKNAVKELFGVISDKVASRPGGYTRIIKMAPRFGDAADMAMIELVDFNTLYVKGDSTGTKKTRRSRRGGSKSKTTTESNSAVETNETTDAKDTKAAPAKEAAPATKESANATTDDLTKIEGVGPKVAEALNNAGLHTFADVSAKKAEDLKAILDTADGHFNMQDPTTWPQQAELAAAGKWEELQTLQEELKGGKKAE